MMYNEQQETTLCQFLRPKDREQIAARARAAEATTGDFLSAPAAGPNTNAHKSNASFPVGPQAASSSKEWMGDKIRCL